MPRKFDNTVSFHYLLCIVGSFLLIAFAYLVGSIPVGVILAGIKGKDPRFVGSGNIGATNVMRAAGKVLGIITLIGDIAKGLLPTLIAVHNGLPGWLTAVVGFAAFMGHIFPVFLKFRGGKGVATALGVYLALSPPAILVSFAVFVVVLLIWKYVSTASIAGAALVPLTLYILNAPLEYVYLSLVVGTIIIAKHSGNIRRLIAGTEHRMGASKN